MADIVLTPLAKPVIITVAQGTVQLPENLAGRIEDHWQKLTTQNPHLFNGGAFTVTSFTETPEAFLVELTESDYAHTLYCETYDAGEHTFRVIHSATLVITGDNKLVIGQMNKHTARAGVICCSGGGIDHGDLRGNLVDLEHSSAHELREELGMDPYASDVTAFFPAYIKTGGPKHKISVLYEVHTTLSSHDFAKNYKAFVAELADKAEKPEYAQLFYVENTPQAVEQFIAEHNTDLDEYLADLLRATSSTAA